jgi:stage II sporulation protein AA (anti-sigma F factor antagonist)
MAVHHPARVPVTARCPRCTTSLAGARLAAGAPAPGSVEAAMLATGLGDGEVGLIEHSPGPDTLVVEVWGRVDWAGAPAVTSRVHRAIAAGRRWILLDLTQVPSIGSAFLAGVVDGHRRLRRRGGAVVVVGADAAVAYALRHLAPRTDLELRPTLQAALDRLPEAVPGGGAGLSPG